MRYLWRWKELQSVILVFRVRNHSTVVHQSAASSSITVLSPNRRPLSCCNICRASCHLKMIVCRICSIYNNCNLAFWRSGYETHVCRSSLRYEESYNLRLRSWEKKSKDAASTHTFLPPTQKYQRVSGRKGVAEASDMERGGQGSWGQRATVNHHIGQEIFSFLTSSSGVLRYEGFLVKWIYKHKVTCNSLESEQVVAPSKSFSITVLFRSRIWRGSMFRKHARNYALQTDSISDHTGPKCLVWTELQLSVQAKLKTNMNSFWLVTFCFWSNHKNMVLTVYINLSLVRISEWLSFGWRETSPHALFWDWSETLRRQSHLSSWGNVRSPGWIALP